MNSSISIERKRVDCNSLPKGWQREEVLRKSGISAGKVDVFYYSPTGKKIESKPQLARYLGDAIDIGAFDFHSGKFVRHMPPPSISLFRCSNVSSSNIADNDNTSMPPPPPQCSGGNTLSLSVCSSSISSQSPNTNASILQSLTSTTTSNTLKRKYKAQSQSQSQVQNQNQSQTHQSQGMYTNVSSNACTPPSPYGAATTSTASSRQQLELR